MEKRFNIPLDKEHSLIMKINLFGDEQEIDLDRLLKIDSSNIHMEIATFPVVLNKVGFLLADAENAVNIAKLDVEVISAQIADEFRNAPIAKGEKSPSNEKVNEHVSNHANYKVKKRQYFTRMKERDYLNSLYWALKSKDEKLRQLSHNIEVGDMAESIINNRLKSFNYVDIKILRTQNV